MYDTKRLMRLIAALLLLGAIAIFSGDVAGMVRNRFHV